MQQLSKYDLLAMAIQASAGAAGVQAGADAVTIIKCATDFIMLGQPPNDGQNVIQQYQASVEQMAIDWCNFYYNGGDKPEWVTHITG